MEVCSLNTSARGHPKCLGSQRGGMRNGPARLRRWGVYVYAFAVVAACASTTRRLRRIEHEATPRFSRRADVRARRATQAA